MKTVNNAMPLAPEDRKTCADRYYDRTRGILPGIERYGRMALLAIRGGAYGAFIDWYRAECQSRAGDYVTYDQSVLCMLWEKCRHFYRLDRSAVEAANKFVVPDAPRLPALDCLPHEVQFIQWRGWMGTVDVEGFFAWVVDDYWYDHRVHRSLKMMPLLGDGSNMNALSIALDVASWEDAVYPEVESWADCWEYTCQSIGVSFDRERCRTFHRETIYVMVGVILAMNSPAIREDSFELVSGSDRGDIETVVHNMASA